MTRREALLIAADWIGNTLSAFASNESEEKQLADVVRILQDMAKRERKQ